MKAKIKTLVKRPKHFTLDIYHLMAIDACLAGVRYFKKLYPRGAVVVTKKALKALIEAKPYAKGYIWYLASEILQQGDLLEDELWRIYYEGNTYSQARKAILPKAIDLLCYEKNIVGEVLRNAKRLRLAAQKNTA